MENIVTFDIIVPIYNIENELEACLNSLLSQTYPHYQVIMVDDGSTDRSGQIARTYSEKDERFNYFLKENGGLSDARNFGFAKTSHDYIIFLDGDDYLSEDALAFFAKELSVKKLDILEFNGYYVENGEILKPFNQHYIDSGVVKDGVSFLVDNTRAGCMYSAVCFKVIRRDFLVNLDLPFEKGLLHEDELWTPQLYLNAETVEYLDKKFYHYVQRIGSIMHQKNKDINVLASRMIFHRLETIYRTALPDARDLDIMLSYLARKMLGSFYERTSIPIGKEDVAFVKRNAKSVKSSTQLLIFLLWPQALPTITKAIKKLTGYKG